MVTTNNPIDAISMMNTLSPPDGGSTLVQSPEFREWLSDYLDEHKMTVTFKKKDGTLRKMYCTKSLDLIPSEKHPKGSGKSSSDESIAAFDLELGDWRSFVVANVVRFEYDSE